MDSLRYFAVQQLKIETLVNLALRNRAVEGFFQAVPAVKPMLFLYHVWRMIDDHGPRGDRRWDLIICDLPTSGFVQGMYQIPLTLQQTFRAGPVHGYGKAMGDLLLDRQRTGLLLVTLPEEMPVVETLELRNALEQQHHVQPVAVLVNGVFPAALDAGELAELATAVQRPTPDAEAVEDALAVERMLGAEPVADLRDLGAHLWAAELLLSRRVRAQGLLPRLAEAVQGRVLELPFLFRRDLPLAAIDQLATLLDGGAP
jgi:anion-transporting  ArsA/GET3 family ATPase